MYRKMAKALTFDDVALVPQFNNISSRTIPSLETWLTKKTRTAFPLIPANMDTVISPDLAQVIIANGGYPIFHRFASINEQKKWVKEFDDKCYISSGINDQDVFNAMELLKMGARGVCVDIAHGHSTMMIDTIKKFKSEMHDKEVIAGNVCTSMGYQDLVNAGADAVKVGVGSGSCCSTRMVTGFGVPQLTAILDCAEVSEKLRVPIISDGGAIGPNDVAKALGAGACSVMMGSVFSKTFESAGQKYLETFDETSLQERYPLVSRTLESLEKEVNNLKEKGVDSFKIVKKYRGQASKDFQVDFKGGLKKGTVPEGVHFMTDVTGSTQELIDKYTGSLKSSMTYGGAKSIEEFQRKVSFVEVTNSGMTESKPRPYQ